MNFAIAEPLRAESDLKIDWYMINGTALESTINNLKLSGIIGQIGVDTSSNNQYMVSAGFWQNFDNGCDCRVGDANNDEIVNVGDVVYLIAYIFKMGPPPAPYPICSGDVNCDCLVNVGDGVFLISYIFKGGPPPCGCEEWRSACDKPMRNGPYKSILLK
jgi:hypothetical protein